MVTAHLNFGFLSRSLKQALYRAVPFGLVALIMAGLVVGGCTTATSSSAGKTVVREVIAKSEQPSAFQRMLDRHGVPLSVPQKGKAILVNIPSYELIALEDGEPVMRSRVIVGRNVHGDRTPELDTETSVVRFRPTWRPTPKMVRSGKYKDRRWPAGPKNPLGLLAIRLEPGMLIYLHGTNQPQFFERGKRALSGGCIRVERWDEVAAWVLGTSVEEVHSAAHGSRTFDMETDGVTVMLRYFTEFPDATGVLRTHDDVYRRGAASVKLARAS